MSETVFIFRYYGSDLTFGGFAPPSNTSTNSGDEHLIGLPGSAELPLVGECFEF